VVITDDANPIQVHRAGRLSVTEENFVRKVVQNGVPTGEYFGVPDVEVARQFWSGLSEHACVWYFTSSATLKSAVASIRLVTRVRDPRPPSCPLQPG
jgi:hypothetical protein